MKTNKRDTLNQRQIIEAKIKPWMALHKESKPPSGWIKAIRGALGLTTRQLADHLGINHSSVLQLEERESTGKISLDLLTKAADAMDCKLIYAVIPKDLYQSLDAIIENRARLLAQELVKKVEHSMRLEAQGSSQENSKMQSDQLAQELKAKLDSRLWDKKPKIKGRKKAK